jgi:TonB family protein
MFICRNLVGSLLFLSVYASAQDTISIESNEPMFVCSEQHPASAGPCATAPRAIKKPSPSYAEKARRARVEGTVVLQLVVGTDGTPQQIHVTTSLDHGLDKEAIAAVKEWRFEPGTYNGSPVPVQLNLEINFRLTSQATAPRSGQPPAADLEQVKNLYNAANEAYNRREYQTATNLARRVTALAPRHGAAWNLLGMSLLEINQLDAAEAALKKQIEVDPGSHFAYNNLGRVYWRQRKYTEAITQFQKQIAINPQDHYAHGNLGMVLRDQKKCAEALSELQQALALTPNNANVLLAMGECDLDLGNKAKGISEMEQATSTSSSANMWNNAAYQLALRNVELDRAEKWADMAVAMQSLHLKSVSLEHLSSTQLNQVNSLASYWDTLGWIYFLRDQPEPAERYIRSAWELRYSEVMGDHLGQIYEKLGRKEDAIDTYAMAIAVASLSTRARPDLDSVAESRERLTNLVGSKQQAAVLVEHAQADVIAKRTLLIANAAKIAGTGDFTLLQLPPAKITEAHQISGGDALKPFTEALKTVQLPANLPGASAIELPRRGTLNCAADRDNCQFVLLTSDEASDLAGKEAASDTIAALPSSTADPHSYQNPSVGIKIWLPDEWSLLKEDPGSAARPWNAMFGKTGTLALLVLTHEHLESTPDLYRHMLDRSFSQHDDFKRTGDTAVVRDGISGTHWTLSWSEKGVPYRATIEFFSVGDDHYRIAAVAPTDVFPRYAQNFDDIFQSVQFPLLHTNSGILFQTGKP